MSDWRRTVRSQAEQVVEFFEISAHNERAVETLTTDSLFQELALAQQNTQMAYEVTIGIDADRSEEVLADDVEEARDDLLDLLRDRGATLLLSEAFDVDGRPAGDVEGSP